MGIIRDRDEIKNSKEVLIPSENDCANTLDSHPVHKKVRRRALAISGAVVLSGMIVFGGVKYQDHRNTERYEQISNSPAVKNLKGMFPGFRDLELVDNVKGFQADQKVQGIKFTADVVDSKGEPYRPSNGATESKSCLAAIEGDDESPEVVFMRENDLNNPVFLDNFDSAAFARCVVLK